MKENFAQQELLLMKNTSFFQGEGCLKEPSDNSRHHSPSEQLEEACWNGLLDELLLQIIDKTNPAGKCRTLYVWQIRQHKLCLQIELAESTSRIEKVFSIDPNYFLSTLIYN